MTKAEIAKLIYVVKATYPNSFSRYTTQDLDNMISAWLSVLTDYTYEQGSAGLKVYLSSDTKGFPPCPGQIVDNILKLCKPKIAEMTGTEAWAIVRKAIRNGYYGAEEEFEKLPPACQRAIGSPASLRELAQIDTETVETVEQSHFIRAYNTQLEREREDAKIPSSVRALIGTLGEATAYLEDKAQ